MLTVNNLQCMTSPCQARMIVIEDEIYIVLNRLDQNKNNITNNINQLLYDEYSFDSFLNKDHAIANYLTFGETFLLEKHGTIISHGEYYLSE